MYVYLESYEHQQFVTDRETFPWELVISWLGGLHSSGSQFVEVEMKRVQSAQRSYRKKACAVD